jgi:hypothetical protein
MHAAERAECKKTPAFMQQRIVIQADESLTMAWLLLE